MSKKQHPRDPSEPKVEYCELNLRNPKTPQALTESLLHVEGDLRAHILLNSPERFVTAIQNLLSMQKASLAMKQAFLSVTHPEQLALRKAVLTVHVRLRKMLSDTDRLVEYSGYAPIIKATRSKLNFSHFFPDLFPHP